MGDRKSLWNRTVPVGTAGPDAISLHWERWQDAAEFCDDEGLRDFIRTAPDDPVACKLLNAIFSSSPYLTRSLIADQDFARHLIRDGAKAAQATALEGARPGTGDPVEATDALMQRLRIAKRRSALAIGLGDIAGGWSLDQVTGALSDLAEAALQAACRNLLAGLHAEGKLVLPCPDVPEQGSGLVVLGMGKLGARELNYSSDIDLILLFDQDAPLQVDAETMQRLFSRVARELVKIIGLPTAHGYVFRTDLRLRPDPSSTPPALSIRAAGNYYQRAGRNWERAAMIKARALAGDIERGEAFLADLQPFVWRRHLDFEVGQDIQTVKRQIDSARRTDQTMLTGRNIKLGTGGIREIEFFAQAQQLIWGGQNPDLRAIRTLDALRALVRVGRVSRAGARELEAAYGFLRQLEHRLQMVNDEQTQSLPETEEGVAGIAAFMGFADRDSFAQTLLDHLGRVEKQFSALFKPGIVAPTTELHFAPDPDADDDPETLKALGVMGFDEPEHISAIVRAWAGGRRQALSRERARAACTKLAPMILGAFATMSRPGPALARFDEFLGLLPDGSRLFSLLSVHPELFVLLAEIMDVAPRLVARLARRPDLLDTVLSQDFADLDLSGLGTSDDAEGAPDEEMMDIAQRGLIRLFYAREFTPAEMAAELESATEGGADRQALLDNVRIWANDRMFRVGVHMLRGLLSPAEAEQPLSNIADACIIALIQAIEEEFIALHGRIAGGDIAVIAYGMLGSREMMMESDLELLFLYDHDPDAGPSDGAKPLAVGDYYARLSRRLIGAIAIETNQGKLYEVDMRPRLSGNAGPITSSREAFETWQRETAGVPDHQALTRARLIHAPGALGAAFEALRLSVLTMPRARDTLASEIIAMRERIRDGVGGADDVWSIEHRSGGLLDVEFIARFIQLSLAAEHPEILAGASIPVFEKAGELGVLDADGVLDLVGAARLWRDLLGILRVVAEKEIDGDEAMAALKVTVGRTGGALAFESLVELMAETAQRVTGRFQEILKISPPGGQNDKSPS